MTKEGCEYRQFLLQSFRKFVHTKGQLISKTKCQAVDSPKKRTNEFAFFDLKSCYVVKSNAVRSFFWRMYGLHFAFEIN